MDSLVDRYRERLPVSAATPVVSLGEGSTPLLHAPRISRRLGVELYLKCEGANPTGSFKDRGMTVAISKALEAGARGGRLRVDRQHRGVGSRLRGPRRARSGRPAARRRGRAREARTGARVGARVLEVRGTLRRGPRRRRASSRERGTHVLVNSLNPDRLEGQKTAAFEIVEELGAAPDVLALPYGGGGNLTAYARGFAETGATATPRCRRGRRARVHGRLGDPHRGRPRTRHDSATRSSPPAAAS